MNKQPLNRLILIGNGFDRAHGLETNYNSFILWYVTKCFTEAENNKTYKDLIFEITREPNIQLRVGSDHGLEKYINHFYECGFAGLEQSMVSLGDSLNQKHSNAFSVKIHSGFFKRLLSRCSSVLWVEIENEYYKFLKEILDEEEGDARTKKLERLHLRFAFIIGQLAKYLRTISQPKPITGYKNILESHIFEKDVVNTKSIVGSRLPDETHILNFNYTPTIDIYLSVPGKKPTRPYNRKTINFIHGELDKPENPIIFGFGDELDKAYEKMELQTNRGFFSFIKSFWYFKTSNYHNLIRFIDSAEFQVVVLGHSCGLSDRTMLNMIFEHDNCVSVKIYYHGDTSKNNYTEITQDISRHFKNKQQLRRKIVPFDKSESMPQYLPSHKASSSGI